MRLAAILLAVGFLGFTAHGEVSPADGSPVHAECHMIIVSQADMLKLMPDLQDDAKIDGAWTKLHEMIEKGTATLVADLVARGALGENLTCDSVEELRYATEFEPPYLPEKIPNENAVEFLKAWPHVGITPTAFEVRNVGQFMTISVKLAAENGPLLVNAAPEHVRFLRWDKCDAGRFASGERLSIDLPIFHRMKSAGTMPLRSGQRVLLSVHRVPESEKPMFELFLLRVTVEKPVVSK